MRSIFFPVRFYKHVLSFFLWPILLFILVFSVSAAFFWGWELSFFIYFTIFMSLGLFSVLGIIAYYFTKQFSLLLRRTYRMSSKFRFWAEDSEEDQDQEDEDLFYEMDRALSRVRHKLLKSRRRLAHELEQGKTLMRYLQDAVVTLGLNGECHFFNSAFATFFLDKKLLELFQQSGLVVEQIFRNPFLLEKIKSVVEKGQADKFQMELLNRVNQNVHDFSIMISPLFEEKDRRNIYGVMILFHDISEYKKAEKLRLEFVENASHELRTPLTSVKGYLDFAVMDAKNLNNKELLNYLEAANDGVNRLVYLVNDLLDLSKMDQNKDINLDWVSPFELTDRVLQMMSSLALTKDIQLKMEIHCDVAFLDEVKIEQILINLVANAIKYNPQGTLVKINWFKDTEGKNICLEVEDNGIGIPEKHWDRLFDRFYRIDESRDRQSGGTGLGLAIVKQLVEAHQGHIYLKQPLSLRGSLFCIDFPLPQK